jgi:type IV secretion system protein VirB10
MSDTNTNSGTPQVKDRRVTPPGILPKNMQAWVVSGIALVMAVVIAFSGRNTAQPRATLPAPGLATIDPNQARIEQYKKEIEERSRKLELEQKALARNQAELAVDASKAVAAPERYQSPLGGYSGYSSGEANASRNAIQAEKAKREYESLFASNVALTYRKETPTSDRALSERVPANRALPESATSATNVLARLLPVYSALAAMQPAATGAQAATSATGVPARSDAQHITTPSPESAVRDQSSSASDISSDSKTDPKYRLYEGTVFETVLTNRLDGAFSGPVNCMVTTNVYSHDGQHLLVPQGTRVLGEVRKVESFGQSRLAVAFHRLIMPDGYSLSLDHFQGLNQIGETGLQDQVNHHYLQVFGISVAIGAIAGLGQANSRTGFDQPGIDAYEQGVATSLSQSALRILDRYLNVLPTVTIREGHRVKVWLSADLLLPAYDKHGSDF